MKDLGRELRNYLDREYEKAARSPKPGRKRRTRSPRPIAVAAVFGAVVVAAAILVIVLRPSNTIDVRAGNEPAATAPSTVSPEASVFEPPGTIPQVDFDGADRSPESIAGFCGNPLVVLGRLSQIGQPQSAEVDTDADGRPDDGYRWIPASFSIDQVVRDYDIKGRQGTQTAEGQELVTRLLLQSGGLGSFRPINMVVGTTYLIFASPVVDIGDGLKAATANAVYRVESDRASSLGRKYELPLPDFLGLLERRAKELAASGCSPESAGG